jgi:hypothetical protein
VLDRKAFSPSVRAGPYLAQGIWMKVIKSIVHRSRIIVFMQYMKVKRVGSQR